MNHTPDYHNPPNGLDCAPGREFYVTVRDPQNPARVGFLLGPYPQHSVALDNVRRGNDLANEANSWAAFYAFGTASLPAGTNRKTVFGV